MRGPAANRTVGGLTRPAGLGLAGLGLAGIGFAMSFAMPGGIAEGEAEPQPQQTGLEQTLPMGLTREAGAEGAHVPPVKRVQPVTPPAAEPPVPLPVRKPEGLSAGATGPASATDRTPSETSSTKKPKAKPRREPSHKKERRRN